MIIHYIWGIVHFGGRCSVMILSLKDVSVGWGRREYINYPWSRLLSDVGLYWHTGTNPQSRSKESGFRLAEGLRSLFGPTVGVIVPTSSSLGSIARVNHRIRGIVRFGGWCSVTVLSLKDASMGWERREYINCPWPRLLSDVGLYWHTRTKDNLITQIIYFKKPNRFVSSNHSTINSIKNPNLYSFFLK